MLKLLTSIFPVLSAAIATAPALPGDGALLLNAYCSTNTAPRLDFPHQLHTAEDFPDPELLRHVGGFINYVQRRGDAALVHIGEHVVAHLHKVRHHLRVSVRREDLDRFHAWASEANAILFLQDGNIYDADGLLLLATDESEADPLAHIPYPLEALQRKWRSEHLLAGRGIAISTALPPVAGLAEVVLRSPAQVLQRLSDPQTRLSAPALHALGWAIGLTDDLPFPGASCETGSPLRGWCGSGAQLRPAPQLLDALDLHYRLQWAAGQALLDGIDQPAGYDAQVAHQRYLALDWLAGAS